MTLRADEIGTLVAGIFAPLAHDLRAGLNGIAVWTHLLGCDRDEVAVRALEGVQRAVARQSALAQELSEFGATLVAQGPRAPQRLDLRAECARAMGDVAASSPGWDLTLGGSESVQVLADPGLLQQLVRLLLLDAMGAATEGNALEITLHAQGSDCIIEVRRSPAAAAAGVAPRPTLRQALAALAAGMLRGRLESTVEGQGTRRLRLPRAPENPAS